MIDIEQLENEINEFHTNIVASRELLETLKKTVSAVQENSEVTKNESEHIVAAGNIIVANNQLQSDGIKAAVSSISKCVDEMNASSERINASGKEQAETLKKTFENAAEKLDEESRSNLNEAVNRLQAAQNASIYEFEHLSKSFKAQADGLCNQVQGILQKMEDAQIDKLHDQLELMNRNTNKKLTIAIAGTVLAIVIEVLSFFI